MTPCLSCGRPTGRGPGRCLRPGSKACARRVGDAVEDVLEDVRAFRAAQDGDGVLGKMTRTWWRETIAAYAIDRAEQYADGSSCKAALEDFASNVLAGEAERARHAGELDDLLAHPRAARVVPVDPNADDADGFDV